MHGHLFAAFLERSDIGFPFVGLVVSGGHTSIYHVKGPYEIDLVGKTRDDAAGEAFDKVAKLLGLGYPGGPVIEKEAKESSPGSVRFPRALMENNELDFSFSGLKTAVLRQVEESFGVSRRTDIPGSFHPIIEERTVEVRNADPFHCSRFSGCRDRGAGGQRIPRWRRDIVLRSLSCAEELQRTGHCGKKWLPKEFEKVSNRSSLRCGCALTMRL